MDFAACDRDERALDGGQAAGRVEELLDVRFPYDENRAQASDSRIALTDRGDDDAVRASILAL